MQSVHRTVSQLFYSISIMFSFEYSSNKAPSWLLILFKGHISFYLDMAHYS